MQLRRSEHGVAAMRDQRAFLYEMQLWYEMQRRGACRAA